MYKCVSTQIDSSLTDLYPVSWSPSHVDLCRFKVFVLVPLEWGLQTLSCFGFSTYSYISRMCSPLVMWSMSNHIAPFALDLKSTYEGEHRIFGLLSLANLSQNAFTSLNISLLFSKCPLILVAKCNFVNGTYKVLQSILIRQKQGDYTLCLLFWKIISTHWGIFMGKIIIYSLIQE
jgi:hypothetical protein